MTKQTVLEYIESFVPFGSRCDGCTKGDPHGIKGYTGDVFCHMQEEVVPGGVKSCGFNEGQSYKTLGRFLL